MSIKSPVGGIRPLTTLVAMEYLRRHAWTPEEAVLILNLLDPRNRAFFKDDGPNEHPMTSVYWESILAFNPKGQPLRVIDWLKWAIEGTDDRPRPVPLSFACEYLAAKQSNTPDPLHQVFGDSRRSSQDTSDFLKRKVLNAKPLRHDPLTRLISSAQESLDDGRDAAQVFAVLRAWASERPPRLPLVGVTDSGIQWLAPNDFTRELSLKNLRDRLRRRRKIE